jgi:hypothetical protein
MSEIIGDLRSITTPVYDALYQLRQAYDRDKERISPENYTKRLREQKSQARELYTYLATWGLMRLRAEEMSRNAWDRPLGDISLPERARKNQEGKREMLECFFRTLERIAQVRPIADNEGVKTLSGMDSEDYMGLTGIALAIAREFSFWADAIYADIQGEESE